MKIFENKVAIITGASFGIGRSTAIEFARRGAKVVLADWIDDPSTITQIQAEGGQAIAIKCDVSKTEDVERLVNETMRNFGRLDYCFNNAGIEGDNTPTQDGTEANWDRVISINLKGVWLCMKNEIPMILKSGKGAIVNCASIAGLIGFPGLAPYVASKHGVLGLTKTAALENAKNNIRINAVCPGVIKTPMVDRVTGKDKAVEKQYEDMEPMGRFGTPEEVAGAVIWLCSDDSSFITGHALSVDGGWSAK